MADSIGQDSPVLHPDTYAFKAWLCRAIFRQNLYPKAFYIPIGVDQSTWSRWTSLEHEQTPPSGCLRAILAILNDRQAEEELRELYTPQRSQSGCHAILSPTKEKKPRR